MDLGIRGKRALVMASSSGLGAAIARALASEGVRVIISGRDEERLRKAQSETGAEAYLVGDIFLPGEGAALVKQSATLFKEPIDILVTNAGGPPKGSFEELTREHWLQGYESLWLNLVEAIQTALPPMKQHHFGRILAVTSTAAREPIAGLTVSNGLRAGLLGLLKSLSREVAVDGVTVNALMPGYTRTERLMELGVSEEKLKAVIPAHRLGKPEELGALAAFLASVPAAYITGQAIACDGGLLQSI